MEPYLIEIRVQGYAKRYVESLMYELSKKFRLRGALSSGGVAHISMYGPFSTNNERELVREFVKTCENYDLITFKFKGFNAFNNYSNKVVYLDVNPSEELKELRYNISRNLSKYSYSNSDFDKASKDGFKFHLTILFKKIDRYFSNIVSYLKRKPVPRINQVLLRLAIIKNKKVLYEYDFLQKKLLSRREALDRRIFRKTIELLKERKKELFDENQLENESVWTKIKNLFRKKKIFLISDLHLDHTNIIRYCNRPFSSTEEMNNTIIKNWNRVVKKDDVVYFIGDLGFGRNSRPIDYWLKKLNGNIIFIRGNHESSTKFKLWNYKKLKYKHINFYLVHDSKDAPKDWNGWIIAGHHHNNNLREFPFINGEKRTINVGVELINYTPLDIDDLFKMNFQNIKHLEISDSKNDS